MEKKEFELELKNEKIEVGKTFIYIEYWHEAKQHGWHGIVGAIGKYNGEDCILLVAADPNPKGEMEMEHHTKILPIYLIDSISVCDRRE